MGQDSLTRSCWTCGYQQIGGMTFLGLCRWFELAGQPKKEIPPRIVDVGCKRWTDTPRVVGNGSVILPVSVAAELWDLARRRNGTKSPEQSRKKSEAYTDHQVDFMGLMGEWAVEQVLHIPFDRGVYTAGDDGSDGVGPRGKVAVKFNHRPLGYLLVERERDFAPPVVEAVLVTGNCRPGAGQCQCPKSRPTADYVLRVVGWIERESFWAQANESDWGLGLRWWVPQSRLNPLATFWRQNLPDCAEFP